jgi:hypothetical protein
MKKSSAGNKYLLSAVQLVVLREERSVSLVPANRAPIHTAIADSSLRMAQKLDHESRSPVIRPGM